MSGPLHGLTSSLADRYVIERQIGTGGMGTVFQAYDRERDERVALKTLHQADATAIYRFKREFRALAGVAHRNLVQLYELVAHDDVWFFTMELVHGSDFLEYVRPGQISASARGQSVLGDAALALLTGAHEDDSRSGGSGGVLNTARLRLAFRQLVRGVAALHQAGKVHRDLKPPNVMVDERGRVVILDFGIASEMKNPGTIDGGIAGTLEYMAPEQFTGRTGDAASDWYAVGVLLYEALTGELPFTGTFLELLNAKRERDAPRADSVVADLPDEIVAMCARLLSRNPAHRPADDEMLDQLRISQPGVVVDPQVYLADDATLVGRHAQLAQLQDAYVSAQAGRGVSFCVHGPSGIGKTTLIHHFTRERVRRESAVLLAGRCYVRESVPYKALDGVVDMLSRLLMGVPESLVEELLPEETAALARVFPVLRRVGAVERRCAEIHDELDRRELRSRAFAALRETLRRLSARQPVIVHIDDLQWSDRDSADLLDGLLASIEDMHVLLVLSFRSEEIANVPYLARLLERATVPSRRAVSVGPLERADAVDFTMRMLGRDWPDVEEHAQRLARESDGNPFLLDQMVRRALESGEEGDTGVFHLGDLLSWRLGQMARSARRLVAVLAVAGQATLAPVAYAAAGLTGDERPLVSSLQIAHILRASGSGELIDVYHDRIREHLLRELEPEETRAIHRRLADSFESRDVDDPEALYEHHLGAGQPRRAAAFAARAAEDAQAALAFERAVLFYERALELASETDPEIRAWRIGLGDALASAGRGAEAAEAYLAATRLADGADALELERRAGQQLMISGRIEAGLDVIRRVLAKVDLQLAPSPKRALLSLVWRRLRLKLRGLRYEERSEAEIAPGQLTRIDTCWAVAEGMALVDNIQGAAFQTLHLTLALDAGEPTRVARALAMEAGFTASSGSPEEAQRLLAEAEMLARRLGSENALGLCRMIGAVAALHGGRWDEGTRLAKEAEAILRRQAAATWPLNIARVYYISNLVESGEIEELCRLSRGILNDALRRGNLFSATLFRTGWSTLVWLCADDVEGARAALAEAEKQCRKGAFHVQHYFCLLTRGMIDLYAGDADAALAYATDVWPLMERSQILRIRSVLVRCLQSRACCALGAAADSNDRDRLLAIAERDARTIEREKHFSVAANQAKARLIRAGVAATRGDRETALSHLADAIAGTRACHAALWHAVATRRRGELLGGDEGAALVDEADRWMAGQSIRNPERLTAALAPGFR